MGIIFSVCPRLSSDRVYKSLFHTVLKCITRPPVLFMMIYGASPLDRKEIKSVNPKGSQPWIFIEKTDAEAEAPILWPPDAQSQVIEKDPDAGKDWRQEEKGTTEDEMVGWHHWLYGHEFEQTLGNSEGWGSLWCCSSWGHKESDTTERLNNKMVLECTKLTISIGDWL